MNEERNSNGQDPTQGIEEMDGREGLAEQGGGQTEGAGGQSIGTGSSDFHEQVQCKGLGIETEEPPGDERKVEGESADSSQPEEPEEKPLSEEELRELVAVQQASLDRLEQEKVELVDRALRLQADFENFRRRTREEAARVADQASEKILLELLPVLDNLERAVAFGVGSEGEGSLLSGVKMVLRQLQDLLAKWEVRPIPAVGESFDPTRHEAIMQVEASEDYPSGTVVEELQKGYMFKGKVLRPSLVKVAQ